MPAPKGHKKYPGAGRPKGSPNKKTVDKAHDEALVLEMVRAALEPMTRAQIAAATGYRHLVARDKRGGKFKSITEAEVAQLNDPDKALVTEIWEKHPSPEAYRHLLDRAFGRPPERVNADITGVLTVRHELD